MNATTLGRATPRVGGPWPRLLRATVLLMLCAWLGGCYANTFATGRPSDGVRKEKRLSFYLGGLVGHHTVDLDRVCPAGAAVFGDERSVVDGILTLITLGIYAPRTTFVECALPGPTPAAATVAERPTVSLPDARQLSLEREGH